VPISVAVKSLRYVLVFALAAIALSMLHGRTAPRYPTSARAAIAAARADAADARYLADHPASTARVIPLDGRLRRVTFFDGSRVVLDAAVDRDGRVQAREEHPRGVPYAGAPVANRWWLLLPLTGLFVMAVTVVPLRRMRNLDALALAGFTANVAFVNAGLLEASVIVSVPLLGYLAVRCLQVGLGRQSRPDQTPLSDRLASSRVLTLIAAGVGVAFLAITLTSTGTTDVAAASLSGATRLLHGQLPYGHIAGGVVHGDTYPLLNYVFYLPGALWTPVTDAWSDTSGALLVTALAALAGALAMRRLAGTRAVLAWLAFPPVLLAASSGSNDVVLAACLAWLLVLAADARRSAGLLAVAAWTKVVPLVLAPLWLARRRKRWTLLPAVALSAVLCAYLVAVGGPGELGRMVSDLSFQFQRGSFFAPWDTLSVEWLQPIVQAAVLTCLAWVVLRVRHDHLLWREPARVAGLCGALVLAVQLSANHWSWLYLPWAFPFVAAALLFGESRLRPSDVPIEVVPERELQPV
jgi:hypothetical protein